MFYALEKSLTLLGHFSDCVTLFTWARAILPYIQIRYVLFAQKIVPDFSNLSVLVELAIDPLNRVI